jgi:osmotically-inducible protein OsmY
MASNQATDRDNTAVNARDRDTAAKTPMDQKENQHDVTITAEIRKKIEATAISENAKNVKVVTADGPVVLRGPVTSMDEKTKIAMIAEQIAGAGNVDDKLEVEVKK